MIRNIVFDMGMHMLRYVPRIACVRCEHRDQQMVLRLQTAIFFSRDWRELES